MKSVITRALIIVSAICSVASLKVIERYEGETSGRHIVTLKKDASRSSVLRLAKGNNSQPITELDIINGFSGYFDEDILLRLRAHPDVDLISEDGIMQEMLYSSTTVNIGTWGLGRMFSNTRLSGSDSWQNFTYNATSFSGSCPTIYVVDGGIRTEHYEFNGRAHWGATFGGYSDGPGTGHGSHCAATAAGVFYGEAKSQSLYAVKVLGETGRGFNTDIIAGLDWVLRNATSTVTPTGQPLAIVSMSIGGSVSTPLDTAVEALTNAGIHVVVSAGNSDDDAANQSPARAPSAVTVGASTFDDARADFSNYGSAVDIFAPGENIISAWPYDTDYSGMSQWSSTSGPIEYKSVNILSGTSMATPHVAGLIANLICAYGNVSPAEMKNKLQDLALKGVLTGIPQGTINALAHNPF